jgi:hypothetical protein
MQEKLHLPAGQSPVHPPPLPAPFFPGEWKCNCSGADGAGACEATVGGVCGSFLQGEHTLAGNPDPNGGGFMDASRCSEQFTAVRPCSLGSVG